MSFRFRRSIRIGPGLRVNLSRSGVSESKGEGHVCSVRNLAFLVLAELGGIALAQTAAPLPRTMSGRWTLIAPGGPTYTGSLSVVLDVPDGVGPVSGRFTSQGIGCGAQDEPLVGTWDGSELRFETRVRANVNAQRMNADCTAGRLTIVLTRKPGQATFEGESRREGVPTPVQLTLAP